MNSQAISLMPDNYKTLELLLLITNLKHYAQYINWDILDQSESEFLRLKYGL